MSIRNGIADNGSTNSQVELCDRMNQYKRVEQKDCLRIYILICLYIYLFILSVYNNIY